MGAGPSQWSHSHSLGGGESGGFPIPFGHWFCICDDLATVTRPIPPPSTKSAASLRNGEERRCVPTCVTRLVRCATSTILRPSTTVSDSGFSTYTSLPALHASMNINACQWSGVAITTASTFLSASRSRYSLYFFGVARDFLTAKSI